MSYVDILIPLFLTVKQKLTDLSQSPVVDYSAPVASTLLHDLNQMVIWNSWNLPLLNKFGQTRLHRVQDNDSVTMFSFEHLFILVGFFIQ